MQLRPEGTWALREWEHVADATRYTDALEVLVEVLRGRGATSAETLIGEARRRYPVTEWRYRQCLVADSIGLTSRGLYDLTENGAMPVEDSEPNRPDYMAISGNLAAVRLRVDKDVLRRSGIAVHRWLGWIVGLRTAPTWRSFTLSELVFCA